MRGRRKSAFARSRRKEAVKTYPEDAVDSLGDILTGVLSLSGSKSDDLGTEERESGLEEDWKERRSVSRRERETREEEGEVPVQKERKRPNAPGIEFNC